MKTRSPRQGFTLLELIIVLALILLITAIAYPNLMSMYSDMRVKTGADHLRARLTEARSHAIDEGRPYRFAIVPGQGGYRIAPESMEYWDDATQVDIGDAGTTPPLVLEDLMPNEIKFTVDEGSNLPIANGYGTLVIFNADGSCDVDVSIQIELDGSRPIEMKIRALTGAVSVRQPSLGGGP